MKGQQFQDRLERRSLRLARWFWKLRLRWYLQTGQIRWATRRSSGEGENE